MTRFYEVQLRLLDGQVRTEDVLAADHLTAQRRAIILTGQHKVAHVIESRRLGGIGSAG